MKYTVYIYDVHIIYIYVFMCMICIYFFDICVYVYVYIYIGVFSLGGVYLQHKIISSISFLSRWIMDEWLSSIDEHWVCISKPA